MDHSCPHARERHIAGSVYVPTCRLPPDEVDGYEVPGVCTYVQTDCRFRPHLIAARQAAFNRLTEAARAPAAQTGIVPAWRPRRREP